MRKSVTLGEVASFSKGQQINGDNLIENGKFDYLNGGISPSGKWSESNANGMTVTISEGGNSCGYVNFMTEPFWCGAHCYYLYDADCNKKYLFYALKSQQERLMKLRSGACMPNIKKNDLGAFRFVYEDNENEQNKVVKTLDTVDNLIDRRKQQLAALDTLIKARFVEMFGEGADRRVKASEVCEFITKGTTPSSNEIFDEIFDDAVPYLKVYNLSFTGELLFDDCPQYISRSVHEGKLARSKVFPNDVLMNIVGPPLGKFALVSNEYSEWNINQAIAIFRAKDKILPRYLLSALMQPDVLRPFIDQAVGIRQQNLSLEQCRNLEISLPDIEQQRVFVEFAIQVDKSKAVVQQALDEAQVLFDSLMQQYFG